MTEPTLISSVQRALHLLEATARHKDGAPAKRLARETGLPLGTAYHLLRTLVHEGYLRKRPDGGFVLGDALGTLRDAGRPQQEVTRTRPALAALRDELGMATYLARYEEGEIRVMDIADGPTTPRVHGLVELGDAAHASAVGKCILGQLDDDSREEYLARHPPYDLTPHTVTHRVQIRRSLAETSTMRWDEQEFELGTGCAAVPIIIGSGVGALAVSYRAERRGHAEAASTRLMSAARYVTYALTLTM